MTDYAKPDSLPFRSYYAQQRRKKRKAANALVQRYITSLSAAGGMYYELTPSLLMNYEFEIEVKVIATVSYSNQYIYDRSSSDVGGRMYCYINSAGTVIAGADTSTVLVDGVPQSEDIRDGKQHTITVTGTSFNRNLTNFGAAYTDTTNFTGEIYDLKIWTGGDRNTGTLVLDMPIDEDWKTSTDLHDANGNIIGSAINVTENEAEKFTKVDGGANWLGEELVTQEVWGNPNTVGSEWSFSNNQWELIGTGDSSGLRLIGTVNQPDIMRLSGKCADLAGQLAVENTLANYIAETGGYSFDLNKASIGVQQYVRLVGVVNATLDKPSIKRLIPIAQGGS